MGWIKDVKIHKPVRRKSFLEWLDDQSDTIDFFVYGGIAILMFGGAVVLGCLITKWLIIPLL